MHHVAEAGRAVSNREEAPRLTWPLLRLVLTGVGLFALTRVIQVFLVLGWRGELGRDPWWSPAVVVLAPLAMFALAAPVIVWLGLNIRISRRTLSNTLLHLAAAAAWAAVYVASVQVSREWILGTRPSFSEALINRFDEALLLYLGTVAVAHLLVARGDALAARLAAARLGEQLTDARLRVLRFQLNPHFLCNALGGINGLIRRGESGRATEMVVELAALLRSMLTSDPRHQIPLSEEIENAERYLSLQRLRFGDRFDVAVAVDSEVEGSLVPTLLLQPLIENVFKHGFVEHGEAATIDLRARRDDGFIVMQLSNSGSRRNGTGNGAGNGSSGAGVGLANVAERLEVLYGTRASLQTRFGPRGGFTVTIRLPGDS